MTTMMSTAVTCVERSGARVTTAQLLERTSSAGAQPGALAPVGLALHHFTDTIIDRNVINNVELHQATTVLTKQAQRCLEGDDWLRAIRALVIDPDRPALGDGRTAQQVCGAAWPSVLHVALQHSNLALNDAARYGDATILKLAVLHGCRTNALWWGTAPWQRRVDEWSARHGAGRRTHEVLASSPEHVDRDVLAAVIADSEVSSIQHAR